MLLDGEEVLVPLSSECIPRLFRNLGIVLELSILGNGKIGFSGEAALVVEVSSVALLGVLRGESGR